MELSDISCPVCSKKLIWVGLHALKCVFCHVRCYLALTSEHFMTMDYDHTRREWPERICYRCTRCGALVDLHSASFTPYDPDSEPCSQFFPPGEGPGFVSTIIGHLPFDKYNPDILSEGLDWNAFLSELPDCAPESVWTEQAYPAWQGQALRYTEVLQSLEKTKHGRRRPKTTIRGIRRKARLKSIWLGIVVSVGIVLALIAIVIWAYFKSVAEFAQ